MLRSLYLAASAPSATLALSSSRPNVVLIVADGHAIDARGTLNELTIPGPPNGGTPPVKSVVLRKRGELRGIRLISYDSLMGYLSELS